LDDDPPDLFLRDYPENERLVVLPCYHILAHNLYGQVDNDDNSDTDYCNDDYNYDNENYVHETTMMMIFERRIVLLTILIDSFLWTMLSSMLGAAML